MSADGYEAGRPGGIPGPSAAARLVGRPYGTVADQAALAADFARVEHEEIGDGVHERYLAIVRELAGR